MREKLNCQALFWKETRASFPNSTNIDRTREYNRAYKKSYMQRNLLSTASTIWDCDPFNCSACICPEGSPDATAMSIPVNETQLTGYADVLVGSFSLMYHWLKLTGCFKIKDPLPISIARWKFYKTVGFPLFFASAQTLKIFPRKLKKSYSVCFHGSLGKKGERFKTSDYELRLDFDPY